MKHTDQAVHFFRNGFNCSQSVLAAFSPVTDLSGDQCLRIATAFGGGMGRQQLTCGAVTGALMVLGLKFGKALHDPESNKVETYLKANAFFREFRALHGSITCCELLNGLDMNNPADMKKINEQDMFKTHCAKYVRDAVEITRKLIDAGDE